REISPRTALTYLPSGALRPPGWPRWAALSLGPWERYRPVQGEPGEGKGKGPSVGSVPVLVAGAGEGQIRSASGSNGSGHQDGADAHKHWAGMMLACD